MGVIYYFTLRGIYFCFTEILEKQVGKFQYSALDA